MPGIQSHSLLGSQWENVGGHIPGPHQVQPPGREGQGLQREGTLQEARQAERVEVQSR